MTSTLASVLLMALTLGGTRAQTVTQSEVRIAVFEGAPVQVKCNYSYSGSPLLFWYVQRRAQGLQLLLKYTSEGGNRGFSAALDRSEKSFHLQKPGAQEEDSATYYCALGTTAAALRRGAGEEPSEAAPVLPLCAAGGALEPAPS